MRVPALPGIFGIGEQIFDCLVSVPKVPAFPVVEFDVFVVHAGYVDIMVLRLFRVEMDLFEDLRDAHRRAVEGALVVAGGQVRDVGVFVREDVHTRLRRDARQSA